MSVLIKGMEMPTSCLVCGFMINCDDCEGHECYCSALDRSIGYMPYNIGSFRRKDIPVVPSDCRIDDCPLVPVPPHGRLIDADALEHDIRKNAEDAWNKEASPINWADAFYELADMVADAPTIIPAEEASE